MCIPKYNLVNPHDATCTLECMFSGLTVWHWDNQLVCSSQGRATSPDPNFAQLPIVPCVGQGPCRFFSFSLVPLSLSFFFSSCSIVSEITREHNPTAKSPNPECSYNTLSLVFHDSWLCECSVDVSPGIGLHNFTY